MVSDFDKEHGLLEVGDFLLVDLGEVLRHRDHLVVIHEFVLDWILREVDVCDNVRPLVPPICNNRFPRELCSHSLLEPITVEVPAQLVDLLEAGGGRHELKDGIDCDDHTSF